LFKPIITPKELLVTARGKDSLPAEVEGCSLAIIAFCPFKEMKHKLSAQILPESLFSHLDRSHQFIGQIAGIKILALDNVYGGPLTATVVEELAHYGITKIIGYGFAGSLTSKIPIGQIVLTDKAFVSDGTSREYLPDTDVVYPNQEFVDLLFKCAKKRNVILRRAKVWTTDAIYREYPEKVRRWSHIGVEVINMDTSPLYAVSKVVGISAIYTCVVSDCIETQVWNDGFVCARQAMQDLQDLILETVKFLGI
jgi:uridine phosphorylase